MASKEEILRAVRAHPQAPVELPDLAQAWVTYPDRKKQFALVLEAVGGRCVFVDDLDQLRRALADAPTYAGAKRVISLVAGVGPSGCGLDAVTGPHDLENVDYAVLPGQFGVAENGAVWVTDEGVKHRAVYFLAQHLALVIPADRILDNMHQAYERLSFPGAGFGVFISGPSKTADIEQSLVIGAHGPRSLTVFCTTM